MRSRIPEAVLRAAPGIVLNQISAVKVSVALMSWGVLTYLEEPLMSRAGLSAGGAGSGDAFYSAEQVPFRPFPDASSDTVPEASLNE